MIHRAQFSLDRIELVLQDWIEIVVVRYLDEQA